MVEKNNIYQYCIELIEGKNAGLEHYVWASEEQILNAMKIIKDNADNLSLDCTVETSLFRNPNIFACFDKNKTGSLKFIALNEYLGNFAAKETGLPLPFP